MTGRRVLAVGAHPDDWECGAGGTLLKHVACGDLVHVLILCEGEAGTELAEVRRMEAEAAAARLGAAVTVATLPDTLLSEHPVIGVVEQVAAGFAPDIAYIHSVSDTHQDHRTAAVAARVALRGVRKLYAWQSPSATAGFAPARFTDITAHLPGKLDLLRLHKSQQHRHYMQPGYAQATAAYWGARFGGCPAAEALEVIADRDHSAAEFS